MQLLQGERVGSQEWQAILAGQTWRKKREIHQGRAGRKGTNKSQEWRALMAGQTWTIE